MERENVISFVSAFALGSLTGAAIALLYAPQSGEDTRRYVGDRIRRGAELGRDKLNEGADYAREKLEQGAELGRQVAQKVVGKSEQIADEAAAYAEEASPFGERRRKPRTVSPEMS